MTFEGKIRLKLIALSIIVILMMFITSIVFAATNTLVDNTLNIIWTPEGLCSGSEFNSLLLDYPNCTSVVFDYADSKNGQYILDREKSGLVTAQKVGRTENGQISFYYNSANSTVYVIAVDEIFANTNCRAMFNNARNATSFVFNNFNTSKTTNMGEMFYNCKSVLDLNLTDFNTENVLNMFSMFMFCEKLVTLDISTFNTSSLMHMDGMFQKCSALTTIYVGDEWDVSDVNSVSSYMFTDCTSLVGETGFSYSSTTTNGTYATTSKYLTGVYTLVDGPTLNSYFTSNLTSINFIYSNSTYGTKVADVAVGNTAQKKGKITLYINNLGSGSYEIRCKGKILANENCRNMFDFYGSSLANWIRSITFNNFDTRKTTNMQSMFYTCKDDQFTELDLSCFNTKNVTDMSYMFWGCNYLKNINLSSFNTRKVTNMSFMFCNLDNLNSLDLTSFNTKSVTTMQNMFGNCYKLPEIKGLTTETLNKNFTAENVETMQYMFGSCRVLNNLDLSCFNTQNVITMTRMFENCTILSNLNINKFKTENVTNMSMMFSSCGYLSTLDISSFDTSSVTNMSSMFSYCSNLTTIYVSDLWTTTNVTSSSSMFYNCTRLKGTIACNGSSNINKTYATYTDGYLTYKAPPST